MQLNIPCTQNTDSYLKKLPHESNTSVILIWCLKQVEDFILKFPINVSLC